jgi:hypothetical protein
MIPQPARNPDNSKNPALFASPVTTFRRLCIADDHDHDRFAAECATITDAKTLADAKRTASDGDNSKK